MRAARGMFDPMQDRLVHWKEMWQGDNPPYTQRMTVTNAPFYFGDFTQKLLLKISFNHKADFEIKLGPSINDVTALGGGGINDFVTTVLKPPKWLKIMTMARKGVKNKNY